MWRSCISNIREMGDNKDYETRLIQRINDLESEIENKTELCEKINTSKENDTMEKKTETAATTEKDPEPSVSKRSRNKEPKTTSTVYTSVKCYLSSIIKSESSRSNVTSTKERFEERCKSVSKMMVKGSLFLRLVVDECLRRYNHLEDEIDKWPDMTKDTFTSNC